MPTSRRHSLEEDYSGISTNIPTAAPEPETDVNVTRGLQLAIGGIVSGAIVAVGYFLYRLFVPGEGGEVPAWDIADFIVMPILGLLYGLIGGVIGGTLGTSVGLVFMGIAAIKEYRESEDTDEEIEEAPRLQHRSRRVRESY